MSIITYSTQLLGYAQVQTTCTTKYHILVSFYWITVQFCLNSVTVAWINLLSLMYTFISFLWKCVFVQFSLKTPAAKRAGQWKLTFCFFFVSPAGQWMQFLFLFSPVSPRAFCHKREVAKTGQNQLGLMRFRELSWAAVKRHWFNGYMR